MLSSSDDEEVPRPHFPPISFDAEDHRLPGGLDELFEDDDGENASRGGDEDDNHSAFIPDSSDEYHFTVETGSPSTRHGRRRSDPGSPSFDYSPDPIYSYLMGRNRDRLDVPDEQLSDTSHLANASPRAVLPPLDFPVPLTARGRPRSPVPSVRVRNDGMEPSPILLQENRSAIWDKAGLPGYKLSEPLRRRKKPGQPYSLTGEKEWLYTGHDEYEGKYPHDYPGEALGPNARVWQVYCDEAQIYDDDMIRGWNTTVDGLLVFAGIFSAVVTTLVVQTSQALQPPQTAKSELLLEQLVSLQSAALGLGSSQNLSSLLEPNGASDFMPVQSDLWVNGLWFSSLTMSLAIAMISGIIKQWLLHYNIPISGTSKEQAQIRHFRYTGLIQWHVPAIIGIMPVFMYIALLTFFVGLYVFVNELNKSIAWVIISIIIVTVTAYIGSNIAGAFSVHCPYKTPVSTLLVYTGQIIKLYGRKMKSVSSRLCTFLYPMFYTLTTVSKPVLALIWKHILFCVQIILIFIKRLWLSHSIKLDSSAVIEKKHVALKSLFVQQDALIWLYQTSSSPTVLKIILQSLADWDGNKYNTTLLLDNFLSNDQHQQFIEQGLIHAQSSLADGIQSFWALVSFTNIWLYNKDPSSVLQILKNHKPLFDLPKMVEKLDIPDIYQKLCNFPLPFAQIDWEDVLSTIDTLADDNITIYERLLTFSTYHLYITRARFYQKEPEKWHWLASWFLSFVIKIRQHAEKYDLLYVKNKCIIKNLYLFHNGYRDFTLANPPISDEDYYAQFYEILVYYFDQLDNKTYQPQIDLFFDLHHFFINNSPTFALSLSYKVLDSNIMFDQAWWNTTQFIQDIFKNTHDVATVPLFKNLIHIMNTAKKWNLRESNIFNYCLTLLNKAKCSDEWSQVDDIDILEFFEELSIALPSDKMDDILWQQSSAFIKYLNNLQNVFDSQTFIVWYCDLYYKDNRCISDSAFLKLLQHNLTIPYETVWTEIIELAEQRTSLMDDSEIKEQEQRYIQKMKNARSGMIPSAEPTPLIEMVQPISIEDANSDILEKSSVHPSSKTFSNIFDTVFSLRPLNRTRQSSTDRQGYDV